MSNNIVLVVEDPVKWKTLIRRQGMEPDRVYQDAVPYYIEPDRTNEHFSEEERRAIDKTNSSPGTVLVRQNRMDGAIIYTPIKEDGDTVASFFRGEASLVHDIVEHFLCLLGGSDIHVYTASSQEEYMQHEKNLESKNKAGNGVANAKVDVSTHSKHEADGRNGSVIESKTERTDADFVAAHEWLRRYPWMQEKFGPFLEQVEKGTLHGLRTKKFGQIICKEIREKYQRGIDVAAKYQLIKASSKNKLSSELKKMVRLEDEWEYSLVLP